MNEEHREEHGTLRDLRDGGFLWLDKEALELISKKAGNCTVAVYCWLCFYANCREQNCFPSITTLAQKTHLSRRSIIRHLQRLRELGVIAVEQTPGKHNIYCLLDVPKPLTGDTVTGDKNITSARSVRELAPRMSPALVSAGTPEQELNEQELSNKNQSIYKPPKEEKIRFLDYVMLTKREHQKLIEAFGEAKTNDYIESLNNYIGSKGNKYKSHYHTILNWVKMEKGKGHATGERQKRPVPRSASGDSQAQLDKLGTEVY